MIKGKIICAHTYTCTYTDIYDFMCRWQVHIKEMGVAINMTSNSKCLAGMF